jgi:uncharacterized protein (DUF1499 family)
MKGEDMRRIGLMVLVGVFMTGCAGSPPSHLGIKSGRFAPCPDKDNCVSSQSNDEKHHVDPLAYNDSRESALNHLKQVVQSMKRTRIVDESDDYLRVEFTSAVMGFVDDVEFYFPDEPIIHIKSASRIGYSDFGVNRKRVEKIRELFLKR